MLLIAIINLALLFRHGLSEPSMTRCKHSSNAQVTYQETHLCERTPGIKSYSGYVRLPKDGGVHGNSTANVFFWFFESRSSPSTAPLVLWLQGGPGKGSIAQAAGGHNGPCVVASDSATTRTNPWSWNALANVLYVDQPVGTGFSYDEGRGGVMDMLMGGIDLAGSESGADNVLRRKGRFATQEGGKTANTTAAAARLMVRFLEVWMDEFERYRRDSISIWSQSYGGHFAPAIAVRLVPKHESVRPDVAPTHPAATSKARLPQEAFALKIDSLGIINGIIDLAVQAPFYPRFANNNTFDIQALPADAAASAVASLEDCLTQTAACRQLQTALDPSGSGTSDAANAACAQAFGVCWERVYGPYETFSRLNPFDIKYQMPDAFPPTYAVGWLNSHEVQTALGAEVNYTEASNVVQSNFAGTGDFARGYLDQIGMLVDLGVKVALIHGDRDYVANWLGGEAISLAMPHAQRAAFAAAGYSDIATNSSYTGGLVRQHGLFSFSRVFEAGHEVPYYQPATAFEIFRRTIQGLDVATGTRTVTASFVSQGASSAFQTKPEAVVPGQVECYLDAPLLGTRCLPGQIEALVNGTAEISGRLCVRPA